MANPPSWNNVIFQTNFADSFGESNGKSLSVGDGAIINTSSAYGASCYYRPATSTGPIGMTINNTSDFAPGTSGAFTVESWVYNYSSGIGADKICVASKNSFSFHVLGLFVESHNGVAPPVISVYLGDDGGGIAQKLVTVQSTGTVPFNSWTHIAVVRTGGTLTIYINGTASGSVANSTNIAADASNFVVSSITNPGALGRAPTYLNGVRVCSEAVYTADFSASLPTSPFPDNPAFPAIQQRAPRSALVLPQINAAIARNL